MNGRTARLGRKLLDGLQYAVAGVAAVAIVAGSTSLVLVGDLVALKWLLFLLGLLSAGLGSIKLRPTAAWRDEPRPGIANERADSGFGAAVRRLPPVASLDYDRTDHLSDGGRMVLLGLLALATSFAMEAILGVGVPEIPGAA